MSQINKAPPFLELSKSTIQNFNTSELDIENVLSIWTGLTKCSKFIKNGKRLENISWRIVNRNLVYSNQIRSAVSSKNLDYRDFGGDQFNDIGVPLPGSYKPLKNKLNDGDFLSLLSIVADQGFIERPPLSRKKSSNKNLTLRSRNKSTENVKNYDNNLVRPSAFRKSSSSKSLKKLNQQKQQKTRSHADLPSAVAVPIENDSDLFEQPNPKLGFPLEEPIEAPPPLTRSDTSTSIVRGFDPDRRSESPPKPEPVEPVPQSVPLQQHQQQPQKLHQQSQPPQHQPLQKPQPKSLFGGHYTKPIEQQSPKKSKTPTLFGNDHAPPAPSQPSLFGERVKSPLARPVNESSTQQPQTSSLFHPQPQPHRPATQQQRPKTLFEQVGISPDVKKAIPSKAKRNNVLNNLGMTSLVGAHQPQGHGTSKKDKSMFFIESSPSPTDSSTSRLSDHNRPISPLIVEQLNSSSSGSSKHGQSQHTQQQEQQQHQHHHYHGHHHHNHLSPLHHQLQEEHHVGSSSQLPRQQHKPHGSRESSRSSKSKKGKSLFGEQTKPLNFSSDSSISDESDWSSVSETDDEEYDDKIRKQWDHMNFERKEAKPQIKRSLLSGLFLNELSDQHHPEQHNRHPSNYHLHSSKSSSTTSMKQHYAHQEPLKSGTITPVDSELGTSVQSSIHIKHRHAGPTNHDTTVLELSTSKPTTVSSTSNVNVPGIVNDKLVPHANNDSTLKSKLTEHDKPLASFSNLISQSAISLTNYFASHRRNSFSSIASDRTRVKFKHESNAPPTASTILPTALSTHMFLPNAHQRAKSRLTALVETDSSLNTLASTTRKNSESGRKLSESEANLIKVEKSAIINPIKSPTLPIPKAKPTRFHDESDSNNFNISRKLSPTTTRRQMLATELSDSLRKSILWDRKHGMYPTTKGVEPLPVTTFAEADDEDEDDNEEHADDEEDDDDGSIIDQWTKKEGALNRKKRKSDDKAKWLDEEETDFYTKGW